MQLAYLYGSQQSSIDRHPEDNLALNFMLKILGRVIRLSHMTYKKSARAFR